MQSYLVSRPKPASSVFRRESRAKLPAEPPRLSDSGERMHVALDLRLINNSGIGNYLRGLLEGFAELSAPIEWSFIGPQCDVPESLEVREWIPFGAPVYSREEFFHYPKLPGVEVLHYPHYNLPLGVPRSSVVTVYDLLHLRYGSFAKRMYQRFFLFRLGRSRAPVITISEKTREDLEAGSSIDPDRITTILLGPGRTPPTTRSKTHDRSLARLALPDRELKAPWFLAVGIDKAHKNMDFLIAAMALWYRRRPNAPPLIWTGLKEEDLRERTARIPAHARAKIHLLPYTADDQSESLYAGAAGLIFPSLDEGFGFPPLEAMSRGVPVLCSRRRPMTDLLGNAPLWFDPRDSATLWRGLDRLLDERGLHEEAVDRGYKQASKYSWAETARRTFEIYLQAAILNAAARR